MKIGMSGAHGTGKTSVFNAISGHPDLKGYTFLGSASRKLANRVNINQEATIADQLAMTLTLVGREMRFSGKDVVTERTPLDFLAYTYYQNRHVYGEKFTSLVMVAEEATREMMTTYDTVCYFPAYWGPEDDGVRPTDIQYQKDINKYIMMYLARFGIRPYVVQNESIDKRVSHMVQWINRRN